MFENRQSKESNIRSAGNDSLKPPYEAGKSILMALGYVNNLDAAIGVLSNKIKKKITQQELERSMQDAYDNDDILYYEYDENGNPVKKTCYTDKTTVFAIYSGYQDEHGNDVYVQYNKNTQGWFGVFFNAEFQIFNNMNSYKMGRITFKNYSQANEFISNLQKELMPGEVWKYAEPAKNRPRKKTEYEILESYITTVFSALYQGYDDSDSRNFQKIVFSDDRKYALFNTGLLSKYATDIIIIGEVFNRKKGFILSNPIVLKRGKTELIEKGFDASAAEIDMVTFFTNVSQVVYDATVEVDTSNIEKLYHCIEEGIKRNRFPRECKEQYERGELEALTETFIKAIRRAEKIARRNYKYVVPQYRMAEKENQIQFLMPIYMLQKYDTMPDFALVLSAQENGQEKFYKPETVLELAWAYNNARVICKPDDMWLNPEKIEDSIDIEEEFAFGN